MINDARTWTASEARRRIRAGEWIGPTAGLAPGYVQANLVVLSEDLAADFERFCRVNPQALPLLDVTKSGCAAPVRIAPDADVRLDLPRYRVYRDGKLAEEVTDIMTLWHADFVAFLIGCSFTFDAILAADGIPVRHVELGLNVPMYVTDRPTVPAGAFSGPLVVSMRPIQRQDIDRVVELTRDLSLARREWPTGDSLPELESFGHKDVVHGEPIQIGSPKELGIEDLQFPDYGDAVPVRNDEVPVFWACGVTAQAVAQHSRTPLMITHAPGHMFVSDLMVTRSLLRDRHREMGS